MNTTKAIRASLLGRTIRNSSETDTAIISEVYRVGGRIFLTTTYYYGALNVEVPLGSVRSGEYELDV